MTLPELLVLITLGSVAAAPILVDDNFFNSTKTQMIYTLQHDIINIYMPGDCLNSTFIFFVEADDDIGHRLMYLDLKLNKTNLVLDGGKDLVCVENTLYIGGDNGIYTFNVAEWKAEKYGSVTENIKNIAKAKNDMFYILTDANQLYKVTNKGNKKTLDEMVVDAQQIVLDLDNNLFYYTANNEVWVISDGVKSKFESLPNNPLYVRLLKPPPAFTEGIPAIVDNEVYCLHPNGSTLYLNYNIVVRPSAYSVDLGIIQFFGLDKRIYLYNFLLDITEAFSKSFKE